MGVHLGVDNLGVVRVLGVTYLTKSWKEKRDGLCKVFCHVPHFIDHQSAVR